MLSHQEILECQQFHKHLKIKTHFNEKSISDVFAIFRNLRSYTSRTAERKSLCKTFCNAANLVAGTSPDNWSFSKSSIARLTSELEMKKYWEEKVKNRNEKEKNLIQVLTY